MEKAPFTESKPAENDDFVIEIDPGSDVIVPKGTYPAMVAGVKSSFSNAGNPMLVWEFTLLGKEYLGKNLTLFTAQTLAAMWKLNAVIAALGFTKDDTGKIKFTPAEAKNRRCVLHVVEEEWEGQTRSSIKSVIKHPEGWKWPEGQQPPNLKGNSPF